MIRLPEKQKHWTKQVLYSTRMAKGRARKPPKCVASRIASKEGLFLAMGAATMSSPGRVKSIEQICQWKVLATRGLGSFDALQALIGQGGG